MMGPPDVAEENEFYLDCFWQLHTTRSIGFGVGPIPWQSLYFYGIMCNMTDDQFSDLEIVIRGLDGVYLSWCAEQNKPAESQK